MLTPLKFMMITMIEKMKVTVGKIAEKATFFLELQNICITIKTIDIAATVTSATMFNFSMSFPP